ncbi:MAG: phage integrase SAM-like domain-containing protein [Segatella copri]
MDYVFVKSQKKGHEEYGSLRARVRYEGKVYKMSLGIKIKEHEWLKYKSLKYTSSALMTSLGIRYGQFASMLMQIKHSLEESFIPDQAPSVIHSIIYSNINKTSVEALAANKPKDILLRDYLTTYIDDLKTGVRTKQRHSIRVSDGYINNVEDLLKKIKGFEVANKKRLRLDDVTMLFQRLFIKYLRDLGLKPNTIATRLSAIRTIMQVAYLEKKTTNLDHQNPQFVPCREEVDEIFLNPDQIDQMMKLDLSSKEVLQGYVKKYKLDEGREKPLPQFEWKFMKFIKETRDVFIVGCLTGQRHSDYSRINSDMIVTLNDKQFIKLRQKKTKKEVYIPLDNRVKEILDKYNGELPYICICTFRNHLHLLGEFLGWTEVAKFATYENTDNLRICDMLTTHTARRSFATNAYAAGISIASIIAVTGHASERSFRTYMRLDVQEKATIAAENFKGFIQM